MTTASDQELFVRYVEARDEVAFSELVERHARWVLSTCRRILDNRQDAEDVAQAVFFVLAKKAGAIDASRPLAPWLYRVASDLARNALRDRQTRERHHHEAAAMPRPEAIPDISDDIDAALGRLPERERSAIVLFHLEGRSLAEIARLVRRPANSVGSWLARGRDRLRTLLVRRGIPVSGVALISAFGALQATEPPIGFAAVTAKTALAFAATGATATPVAMFAAKGCHAMKLALVVKSAVIAASVTAVLGAASFAVAAESGGKPKANANALMGSPDFLPTPERPVGWRADGSGRFPGAVPPTKWSRTCVGGKPESTGVLWMTPIPRGASSPILVGDRIFVGFDPYGLICISKTDGHVLWYRTNSYYETMPEEQRKTIADKAKAPYDKMKSLYDAEIKRMSDAVSPAGYPEDKHFMDWQQWGQQLDDTQKQLDAVAAEVDQTRYKMHKDFWEWASATPVSDGTCVYMWFSHHVAACYDLDGNRQWATVELPKDSGSNEHGRHSSPLLVGDTFVAEYGIDLIAFDRKTGKPAWTKTMANTAPWVTPAMSSLAVATVAGQPYVVACRGDSFRASDGEIGWKAFKNFAGGNSTPIIEQNRIFISDHESVNLLQIPAALGPNSDIVVGKSLKITKNYMMASPLLVDGLVYVFDNKALLHVFDPASGTEAYSKQLPLNAHEEYVTYPGCSVSPTLAGKYIYIMDNQGGTLVLEPGPQYKEVAINHIETFDKKNKDKDGKESTVFEQTVSHPIFSGKQLIIRGQQYLYCIGSR